MIDDFDEAALFSASAISENPLADYFRIPGMHVRLPSGGIFLPRGAFHPTLDGDIQVYPMTAADELLLKSPDALMSGYALQKLIESCVPGIKAPRRVSTGDLDVLLLAIRAATYGENMDMDVTCEKCEHENSFECFLPRLLDTVKYVTAEDAIIKLNDQVTVFLRPYDLEVATQIAIKTYEEARKLQNLQEVEDADERQAALNESVERMHALNTWALTECVLRVDTPKGSVTDRGHITEFMKNIAKPWTKRMEDQIKVLNTTGIDKTIPVKCAECGHEWRAEVEFDPANFFAEGS